MSWFVYFYAADPSTIVQSLEADPDSMERPQGALASADFSCHLADDDFDLLARVFSAHQNKPPVSFLDSQGDVIHETGDGNRLIIMKEEWTALMASGTVSDADALTRAWIQAVYQEHKIAGEPKYDENLPIAVQNLIQVCRTGREKNVPVIYAYFM